LVGKLGNNGRTNLIVPRVKQGKEALFVSLDAFSVPDQIVGTISNSEFVASLQMDRAVFNKVNLATNFSGKYTVLIPHSGDATISPGGDGYGSVNVLATNGALSFSAVLGDGQPVTQAVQISKDGDWPLYAQFYPVRYVVINATNSSLHYTNVGYNGSLLGWISLSNHTPTGVVSWIKTGWTNKLYPDGFTNRIALLGSEYRPPAPGTPMVAISNGTFVLSGGNLEAALTNTVYLRTNNMLVVSNNSARLTVTLAPASGLIAGSFSNAATQALTPFKGAVLQQQNLGGGWFSGTNQTGSFRLQGN
jgi:hypothetical protein